MKMPKNGMTNSPTIALAVAIRIGVLGMRSRRMVRPVSTREALQPIRARAAAMMPVAQEAVEPMSHAQASMVMMATGDPGRMGKMMPARATSISRAAMTVTMTSTGFRLLADGDVCPNDVVGVVAGLDPEVTAVDVVARGAGFQDAGVGHR